MNAWNRRGSRALETRVPLTLLAMAAANAGCLGAFREPLDGAADVADARSDLGASDGADVVIDDRPEDVAVGDVVDTGVDDVPSAMDAGDTGVGDTGVGDAADALDVRTDTGVDVLTCDGGVVCMGRCVDTRTDRMNCGACGTACAMGMNTSAVACVAGACQPTCNAGFANCDGDPANGCETPTNTLTDCGGCGVACSRANATATCASGSCRIGMCNAAFGDCDSIDANGCEANLNAMGNCGACGRTCSGATPNCSSGMSGGTCTSGCTAPLSLCGGSCVNRTNDALHCGACGTMCSFANAGASCVSSACVLGACSPNFANCDGMAANGCETNTNTSLSHCGACGATCTRANATPACMSGSCSIGACNAGFGNCNMVSADGCEANLTNSTTHCGSCGNTCTFSNGTGICNTGMCSVTSCNAGFDDCDRSPANGCETGVRSDINNCGACGTRCSFPNAVPACSSGSCRLTGCQAGFVDVDRSETNGCECMVTNPMDPPDSLGRDENCDGVDGVRAQSLYVDGATGSDAEPGTDPARPKRTLRSALLALSGRTTILLTTSIIDETFHASATQLVSGVGVYGGYNPGFASRTTTRTRLNGPPVALEARSLASGTLATLSQIEVVARDVGTVPGSSIALRVIDSGRWPSPFLLQLDNVRLQAGSGGVGSRGPDGRMGAQGGSGTGGTIGGGATGAGGSGGRNSAAECMGGDGGGGGAGGGVMTLPSPGNTGFPGLPAPMGGMGGIGGLAGATCTTAGNNGLGGGVSSPILVPGGNGMAGTNGLMVMGSEIMGFPGGNGFPGSVGVGGGGGGGGSGACSDGGAGGGGGGGGAGGCPGLGGFGGQAGGLSAALVLINSALIVPSNCQLTSRVGGTGGSGGDGGPGGPGGAPGTGGGRSTRSPPSGAGGSGGTGSPGSAGGRGAGGAGGASACIVTSAQPYMPGAMSLMGICTLGAGGVGGSGGNPGAAGQSSVIIHVP